LERQLGPSRGIALARRAVQPLDAAKICNIYTHTTVQPAGGFSRGVAPSGRRQSSVAKPAHPSQWLVQSSCKIWQLVHCHRRGRGASPAILKADVAAPESSSRSASLATNRQQAASR